MCAQVPTAAVHQRTEVVFIFSFFPVCPVVEDVDDGMPLVVLVGNHPADLLCRHRLLLNTTIAKQQHIWGVFAIRNQAF